MPDLSPEQRKNNIDRLREIMDRAGAISREGGRIRRFDEAYRFEARQRELIAQLGEQPEPVPDNEFQLLLTTKAACELLTAAADVKQLMFVLLGLCNRLFCRQHQVRLCVICHFNTPLKIFKFIGKFSFKVCLCLIILCYLKCVVLIVKIIRCIIPVLTIFFIVLIVVKLISHVIFRVVITHIVTVLTVIS